MHIHGTDDGIINYEGGALLGQPPYTGAEATVGAFAEGAGCGTFTGGTPFALAADVEGAETVPLTADCPEDRRVVLWRVEEGGHEPRVVAGSAKRVQDFAFRE